MTLFACISRVTNSLVFQSSFIVLEVLFCCEIELLEVNVIQLVLVSMNPDFIFSFASSFSLEAFVFVKLFSTPQISSNRGEFHS